MAQPKLKLALIGCGYIGKRYIPILSQHAKCELAALVDTDANCIAAHKNLNIPLFHSAENYFNSNINTDAVIIATPSGTHASIAIAALKQNKHVLIEKPMALKREDAEAIIQIAENQNKKAMVVLQNRFSPIAIWLKEIIDSGILGAIFFVEVNCFWNRDERYYTKDSWHGTEDMDGGTLFTQFSHFIDTIYWLLGDIKNISSRFKNFNHPYLNNFEDTGSVHFELAHGGIGCINFSTAVWNQSLESSLIIITQNGSIKIAGQYMDKVEHCHIKNYNLPAELKNIKATADNHTKMLEAFIEAIWQNGSTNAKEALHSVDIIERMYGRDSVEVW